MDRRSFLKVALPLAASTAGLTTAFADQGCTPSPYGYLCAGYIPINRLARIYAVQQQSEWCWAASISMIFGYYGHPISQKRIVQEAYGAVVNMPGNYPAMLGSLNRKWTDDHGTDFSVSTDSMFAPELGRTSLTNADLISQLKADTPVLCCNVSHAMVLTAMKYVAGNVVEAWVMDPWPGNGLRQLTRSEMMPVPAGQLRFLATIDVS